MISGVTARLLAGFLVTLTLAGGAYLMLPLPPRLGIAAKDRPFYSLPFGQTSPFYPAELRTPDGKFVDWRGVPEARSCGECHLQETLEWVTSAHAISDKDLIYDSTVRENEYASLAARAADGKSYGHGLEKGRWCEACHNPLGILTGAVTPASNVQVIEALEEGTSCIVCHTVNHAQPLAGNGALELDINGVFRYGHPALLAAAPARHAKDMRARRDQPLMGDSALCGACHTEIRPTSVNGATPPMNLQDTYDEWRHSPWAQRGVQCQDCHMSRDPAAYVAALKRGERPAKTVSHRFVGNNYLLTDTSLPAPLLNALRGGAPSGINRLYDNKRYTSELEHTHGAIVGLLREAAELKASAKRGDAALALAVEVANAGAGHSLPTGPLDQRYLWLEVEVTDSAGRTLFHQGAFDQQRAAEDPAAVRWIKQVTDAAGQPVRRHVLFDAQTLRYTRKPIPPGQSDRVDYRIELPRGTQGALNVTVRLWYRIALQDILENAERQGLGKIDAVVPPLLLKQTQVQVDAAAAVLAAR